MFNKSFVLHSDYQPSGDQPQAIDKLIHGLNSNQRDQVLLGVTGSGKTFTMANVIANTQRPALILAHNKTLAAQLYSELKTFFPHNAVEYFISFFDYYQPEAYVPSSDVYIDKNSVINAKIEQMKHSAIYSLLERKDVIVVASVSCIYGIGERSFYEESKLTITKGQVITIHELSLALVNMQYVRNDISFDRGTFRIKGDIVEVFPMHCDDEAIRISFFGDEIEKIFSIDPLSNKKYCSFDYYRIYSATLYATPKNVISTAIPRIRDELAIVVDQFTQQNRLIEAQRIEERVNLDIEMLQATGYCRGIENYIKYLANKQEGQAPSTLIDYLPEDIIIFVDESHVSVPQIRAMYYGDKSRKTTLVNYGFRLPSCLENRPLTFEEWEVKRGHTLYISATPADFELELVNNQVVEQIIRPTGLLDPICVVRPLENQVEDLMYEIQQVSAKGEKILAVTLTKKMAEYLTDYLNEHNIRVRYIHSDIGALERIELIRDLRQDKFDVLVGINLLREGLDIPECSLVAILDADKEGFLRSQTALIQTIGRAARNINGRVILYADRITKSMQNAIDETQRRRTKQLEYNQQHGITPKTVHSKLIEMDPSGQANRTSKSDKVIQQQQAQLKAELEGLSDISVDNIEKQIKNLNKQLATHVENWEFEKAIEIRNKIQNLHKLILEIN